MKGMFLTGRFDDQLELEHWHSHPWLGERKHPPIMFLRTCTYMFVSRHNSCKTKTRIHTHKPFRLRERGHPRNMFLRICTQLFVSWNNSCKKKTHTPIHTHTQSESIMTRLPLSKVPAVSVSQIAPHLPNK
jgi:hypothetical protein